MMMIITLTTCGAFALLWLIIAAMTQCHFGDTLRITTSLVPRASNCTGNRSNLNQCTVLTAHGDYVYDAEDRGGQSCQGR